MVLQIQILAWERHKNVAELNRLMESQTSYVSHHILEGGSIRVTTATYNLLLYYVQMHQKQNKIMCGRRI